MSTLQEITRAKIEIRRVSRDLIQNVFKITEYFPKNDSEGIGLALRKKSLSISSFVSHGTVQNDKDEQGNQFIIVMTELREILKLTVLAKQLGFIGDKHEALMRISISNVITQLDQLVKLLGSFDNH